MSETSEITRRWSGYICPDCRFVFRVPKNHDGVGLVCPSCRRLLKLPTTGEALPQLVLLDPEVPVLPLEESVPLVPELRKRRRKGKEKQAAVPSWEMGSWGRSGRPEKVLMAAMIGGAVLLVIIAVIISRRTNSSSDMPSTPGMVMAPIELPADGVPAEELPDVGAFLRVAEPMARTFLEAKSIPELLAVVRHPGITAKRISERFPEGVITPVGLQTFADDGAVRIEHSNASVKVRIGNFELRDLSYARTKDGWKIDWESWVGWSDLPWEEFMEKAPTTSRRFRVRLKPIIYYNFGFADDRKWRSYLIESTDGQHRLFGYVERGSRVDDLINFTDSPSGGDYILDLCFPADNIGRNQVLITDRIAEGWVEPDSIESR